ncbi:Regulator of G-protein signaling rgs-7 [Toxocara canis]|uniref:Regulator of G-protein signaling rgs-7 n=1 Tax=Toxocara canis TaxID=6265 RepID=A0A0B2UUY6_TOXCA|nr:Regulator of G-protein signaling rgs-7 [Toxocara canis]
MEQQQQQQQQQQRQQQQQQRHGHSPLMLVRSMVTPDGTPKLHKGMRDRAWSRSLTDLYEPQFHLSAFEDGAKRPTQKFDLRIKATVAFIRSKIKSADSNVMPLSQNEARQWQQSFQNLLSNKHGRELFRMFLVHEFSEENIDFWIECEEFRKMKEGKKQTEQRARDIYNKYLAAQAWKEVNLDTLTRMSTKAAIGEGAGPNTFLVAQKKIESLMEKDSYRSGYILKEIHFSNSVFKDNT